MIEKQFELATKDGIIRGSYTFKEKGSFPVLFLLHGFTGEMNGSRYLLRSFQRLVCDNDIGVVKFDYIGCGNSSGEFTSNNITASIRQTIAVINYFKSISSFTEMYIAGYSMGGVVAVEVIKQMKDHFKKLLLWSPAFNMASLLQKAYKDCPQIDSGTVDYFGLKLTKQVVQDAQQYSPTDLNNDMLRVCIISGEIDEAVPCEVIRKGYESFNTKKEIHIIKRANHSYDGLDLRDELYKKSVVFLN